jgi:DNA-binding beta-propeller fold protein YncE
MTRLILALGAAAAVLSAAPADAKKHYSNYIECSKVVNGACVKWHRLTRGAAARAAYNTGYVFGPTYAYTPFAVLPHDYVVHYSLDPNGRYVYSNGYIYVVDPATYAVTRVIDVLGG